MLKRDAEMAPDPKFPRTHIGHGPALRYITDIAPDMLGIYVNEAGTEFTLPRKGWKRFEGSQLRTGVPPRFMVKIAPHA